jgi:F-type H+-transporting ATPase subunit delta
VEQAVAERYAQALFSLARERGMVEQAGGDLGRVCENLSRHPDLRKAFEAPHIPATIKKDILSKLFTGRLSAEVLNLLYLLVDKQRENELPLIREIYEKSVQESLNEVSVEVITAVPLSPESTNFLVERLSSMWRKNVKIAPVVNPDILGGVIVKMKDILIDGSLRHSLETLEARAGCPPDGAEGSRTCSRQTR